MHAAMCDLRSVVFGVGAGISIIISPVELLDSWPVEKLRFMFCSSLSLFGHPQDLQKKLLHFFIHSTLENMEVYVNVMDNIPGSMHRSQN